MFPTAKTSRRQFLKTSIGLFATTSVLQSALATNTLSRQGRETLEFWLKDLYDLCADLRRDSLTPEEWQERMSLLYKGISPSELMAFIDFDSLVKRLEWPESGAAIAQVRFPTIKGMERLPFGRKIFALEQGRAVVPHGHNNTVSAHFVLSGTFHVRTYNRRFDLEEPGVLWVEPSLNTSFKPGDLLTMSDSRDNVHWLVAETSRAYTFDIPVSHLPLQRKYVNEGNQYGMIFIDPPTMDAYGPLRASIIQVDEALHRFG